MISKESYTRRCAVLFIASMTTPWMDRDTRAPPYTGSGERMFYSALYPRIAGSPIARAPIAAADTRYPKYKMAPRTAQRRYRLMPDLFLGPLRAVLGASLLTILHAGGVKGSTNDVILHTRKVLHTTAPHQHNGVLLQVVPLAGDVGNHLDAVRQANLRDLPKCRVRLLRRRRVNARTNATLLRIRPQSGGFCSLGLGLSPLTNQLLNSRHYSSSKLELVLTITADAAVNSVNQYSGLTFFLLIPSL